MRDWDRRGCCWSVLTILLCAMFDCPSWFAWESGMVSVSQGWLAGYVPDKSCLALTHHSYSHAKPLDTRHFFTHNSLLPQSSNTFNEENNKPLVREK